MSSGWRVIWTLVERHITEVAIAQTELVAPFSTPHGKTWALPPSACRETLR